MKKLVLIVASVLAFTGTVAQADPATEQEVKQTIIDGNAYVKKNLKGQVEAYAKEGALEFWSSGGLLNKISPPGRPEMYDSFNINPKHIQVITLVPGKIAVAHYYSEGSMQPTGGKLISNYRTRASQVYVKEDGKWKIRSSHWSAIHGGSGTSVTAIVQ